MKKDQVQRRAKSHVNSVVISFRITPHMSKYMLKENLSARAIVIAACKEFGYNLEED